MKSVPPYVTFKLDPTPKQTPTNYTNVVCKWTSVKSLYIPLLHFLELWSFYMVSCVPSLYGNKQDIFFPRLWFKRKLCTCCKSKLAALKFTGLFGICLKQESDGASINNNSCRYWPSLTIMHIKVTIAWQLFHNTLVKRVKKIMLIAISSKKYTAIS